MSSFASGSEGKESACHVRDVARSLSQEEGQEKEMATHSNILAWEIPQAEEPEGLQSMESQKSQTQLSDNNKKTTTQSEAGYRHGHNPENSGFYKHSCVCVCVCVCTHMCVCMQLCVTKQ